MDDAPPAELRPIDDEPGEPVTAPGADEGPPPAGPPEERVTNSGVGLGFSTIAAPGPRARPLNGLQLELRKEGAVAGRWQLNLSAGLGVNRPQATADVFQAGLDAGAWTTNAFGDVTDWVARPSPEPLVALKVMGAFFAYSGLALTYVAVPVVWAVSPFAAIGNGVVGPTLSFHTSPSAPDAFVEAGLGGAFFVHPETDRLSTGLGPMLGLGGHLGKQSIGVRTWVSPPGAHTGPRDTIVQGSLVVGL